MSEKKLQDLHKQVLIVLADYQTTQDSLYFSRNEGRRVEGRVRPAWSKRPRTSVATSSSWATRYRRCAT